MEEKNIFDVSVILPIDSSKHLDFNELLERSIKSLKNQTVGINELVIVHTSEETLKLKLSNFDFSGLTVNLVENDGSKDFATQVNLGVKNAKSKWVSILEFDDEYSSIWFKNVKRFAEAYSDVEAFLPLVVDTDEKGVFAGFTNEASFAVSLNSEIGALTNEVLLNYQNFQSSGMVIKKSTFESNGGLKPSIKLTFVYEYLLRLTYNSVKIMTIPRIGYKHTNMREGSIFWNYKYGDQRMTDNEVSFWLETAKKEHFFTADRDIKYEPQTV
jgi:glycosyltransferase involved in cell wall biosynthesis